MENHEIFSNLALYPPVFLRLDGRAFHRLTRTCEKPFDARFHAAMVGTCRHLIAESGLNPLCAYTFSDEISLYLTVLPFGGRVEKLDSIAASYAASAFTLEYGCAEPVAFDARIIPATPAYAAEYLAMRQAEAWRNHINAYCQAALQDEGLTSRAAAARLLGMKAEDMHGLMFSRGVNLAETPAWQRRGTLVRKGRYTKEGMNPLTGEKVTVERQGVVADEVLPLFSAPEGRAYLSSLLGA
ncbi:MAG: tRNA(His) guanylyltransferase Thg1 family protein [Methanofollis sp.]|uniref:tRNA(His) guanylyltransferase Thg1 family protein n=1 Tax=Methanofollis sp. TaxID=2052835 RepID=UPI0026199F2D|nr:tRNA(His) guanylyltransferase Thg1 family protein [Methanofollis sp.]MDD4255227.1 tRNA(His) guanylyltransferase Thg1 family protein [Methanofollis sp.]